MEDLDLCVVCNDKAQFRSKGNHQDTFCGNECHQEWKQIDAKARGDLRRKLLGLTQFKESMSCQLVRHFQNHLHIIFRLGMIIGFHSKSKKQLDESGRTKLAKDLRQSVSNIVDMIANKDQNGFHWYTLMQDLLEAVESPVPLAELASVITDRQVELSKDMRNDLFQMINGVALNDADKEKALLYFRDSYLPDVISILASIRVVDDPTKATVILDKLSRETLEFSLFLARFFGRK